MQNINFKKDVANRVKELMGLPGSSEIVKNYERGLITLSETITLLKQNEISVKAAKKYFYGMRARGFSIGCQPMNGLIKREPVCLPPYYDVLSYGRQLTEEEMTHYSLDFISCDTINN